MASAFVEDVLAHVDTIPAGRVTTYGAVAAAIGQGNARTVGRVMSTFGREVAWWRVVRANGTLPDFLIVDAQEHWLAEGTPVVAGAVNMSEAFWS